jgi:hypothetical protein
MIQGGFLCFFAKKYKKPLLDWIFFSNKKNLLGKSYDFPNRFGIKYPFKKILEISMIDLGKYIRIDLNH